MKFEDFATKLTIYEAYEKVNSLEHKNKELTEELKSVEDAFKKASTDLQEYKAEAERLRNIDYLRVEK